MHARLICLFALSMAAGVGCLRDPIGDEPDDGAGDLESTEDSAQVSDESTAGPCHASYDPCLPVVDDLDCADVEALGAAPVTVLGPDEYELDRDRDGIGCES